MASSDKYKYALKSNDSWASYKGHQNQQFFPTMAKGQAPEILWLGCSDSRVPETTLLGLSPGDVFTHRNIANILSPTDLNFLSVLEYAVKHVKVKHIVLCGHTMCGGCQGALGDSSVGAVLDAWLTPLKVVRAANEAELKSIKDFNDRAKRLAELSVKSGVGVLMNNFTVLEAIKERGIEVHGAIYDIACGQIKDLCLGTDGELRHTKAGVVLTDGPSDQGEEIVEIRSKSHAVLVFNDEGAELTVR
ncbi:putative carbonic anhydrase [Amylocarpus encephaloides]|uniref:Carbonic anhydrase n=1 Tax=Amylocarpus encephaloides TaxID=45428 RepID=A0A9P7YLR8_9HELO|nr:putative carbonic anhydrase [Amylocarpus encephaloides]